MTQRGRPCALMEVRYTHLADRQTLLSYSPEPAERLTVCELRHTAAGANHVEYSLSLELEACRKWQAIFCCLGSHIEAGPIFRPIYKAGTVRPSRLTCRSVANFVK